MAQDKNPQLVGAEWVIEDIAGRGVVDNTHASLEFAPDGSIAGNASCNRFFGKYTLKDYILSIEPGGSTMMACPEAIMDQESRVLEMLPKIKSYTIDNTGALILKTVGDESITARRPHASPAK